MNFLAVDLEREFVESNRGVVLVWTLYLTLIEESGECQEGVGVELAGN